MTPRESGLLKGALNVQALLHPGTTFTAIVLRGSHGDPPRLTGRNTYGARWPVSREVLARLEVVSLVVDHAPGSDRSDAADVVLDLGGPVRVERSPRGVPLGGLRRSLRQRAPVAIDALFQRDTDRMERARAQHPAAVSPAVERLLARDRVGGSAAPKAILFGMYFLEVGGAEKWALEAVSIARQLGATPLVLTDQRSPHPLVEHPAMEGAVFLPLTHRLPPGEDVRLLRALLQTYDVRLVHLHHSWWLYDRLPWLRLERPDLPVLDSLHIHEWRSGGFVEVARQRSALIDTHHVISPELARVMSDDLGVPREKVVMRPLLDLLRLEDASAADRSPDAPQPLTVGFVGRLTQQKRPFVFLALARRMHRVAPGRFRFILHGDGELEQQTNAQIARYGLGDIVLRRHASDPVADTYRDSDVIVLTSDNEGLALVSLEAAAAGCLVISTDVGAQASVVPAELLLPRHPFALLKAAERLLSALAGDGPRVHRLRADQRRMLAELEGLAGARAWARERYVAAL